MEAAIIQYINLLADTHIQALQDLASGTLLLGILNLVQGVTIDIARVATPDTWILKLSNLKMLLRALEDYSQTQLGTRLATADLDLLKISKYDSKEEILKLLELILPLLVSCGNKETFIKKIMQLEPQSQQHITDIIKKSLQNQHTPLAQKTQHSSGEAVLLEKLEEMEQEIELLRHENIKLHEKNSQQQMELKLLNGHNTKLAEEVSQLSVELLERERQPKVDVFDSSSLVQSLKHKLITEAVEHEKEKIRWGEEIEMMRAKGDRVDDYQHKVETYQQRIQALNSKVSDLEEDASSTREDLARKEALVNRLEEKCRLLAQKSTKEELEKISEEVDREKRNVRDLRNDELRRREPSQPVSHDQNQKREFEEELSIASRRIKTLEKQLAKSNLRAQKASRYEKQLKELQDTFITELGHKKEQLGILTSALIQLRLHQILSVSATQ